MKVREFGATVVVIALAVFVFGSSFPPAQIRPASAISGVTPTLECIDYDPGARKMTARFGYVNKNLNPVTIPIGEANYFERVSPNQGQPTFFIPGEVEEAFTVTVSTDTDPSIAWNLLGTTVTADAGEGPYCSSNPADLSVSMSAPRTATQDGDLTYDIEVENAGPRAATGVTLVDALPGGVEFVSATPSVGTCSGTKDVTCSIESIPRDGRESVSIKVSPKQAGELVNTVNVAMNESDLVPSDNFATARTSVSPTVAPPAASTGPASETVHTGATLNALVTPNGSGTTYRFEYGGDTSYGQKTPEQDAGSGMEAMLVEAVLEGLKPGATYHYRVVATSARGTVEGSDRTFTTPASSFARLDLRAKPASVKKGRATTLSGRLVDPSGDGLSRRETTLQARPQGAQRFSDVGEVTTEDDGAFAFRDVSPRGTMFYRVIFDGSEKDGLKASRSSTIRVVVRG